MSGIASNILNCGVVNASYTPTPFVCTLCGQESKTLEKLKKHLAHRHAPAAVGHCCGIDLHTVGQVVSHATLHPNASLFGCPYGSCSSQYSTLNSLQNHMQRKHDAPTTTYGCPRCATVFDNKPARREHYGEVHLVYECSACQKRIAGKYRMNLHLTRVHGDDSIPVTKV